MAKLVGAFAAATLATVVLSGCGGDDSATTTRAPSGGKSIAELAGATKELSTLVAALTAADLVKVFEGTDEYTVFAPTDDAFSKVDKTLLGCLLQPVGKASLTELLEYHVVKGSTLAANLTNNEELTTLEGEKLNVSIVNNIKDPSIVNRKVMVGDATVVTADIMANNGVVHEIDAVLVPSTVSKSPPQCGSGTIADTAVALNKAEPPELTTLVAALTAADLVGAFNKTTGDLLTVFAPTDAAFARVPKAMLTCLLLPANKAALAEILKFHVVPQYVLAADVKNEEKVDTLLKDNQLTFGVAKGAVTVNGALVTQADVFATNGVVHVIDAVLLPAAPWKNPCASVEPENEIQV